MREADVRAEVPVEMLFGERAYAYNEREKEREGEKERERESEGGRDRKQIVRFGWGSRSGIR